ncbi:MAG: glycosyltransferase family 4 protein [Pseudomonadota bacterium]
MSHYAARSFLEQHKHHPDLEKLKSKLMVRHPNLVIEDNVDIYVPDQDSGPLKLTFVGAHFARKGGCVAVRLAEIAKQRGLPIEVTIISSLQIGGMIWTDPENEEFFQKYLKLLDLPNVRSLGGLPNSQVRAILRRSHFCLLPTFADTFGFSAIESMAEYTPVLGTRICALPEFITDGVNGLLLDLPTNRIGEWAGMDYGKRHTVEYETRFAEAVEQLAQDAITRLEPYLNNRSKLMPLRQMAQRSVLEMFDSRSRSAEWDQLYERVIAEEKSIPPVLDPVADKSSRNGWLPTGSTK